MHPEIERYAEAGGPAFPAHDIALGGGTFSAPGQSLRDFFAAAALPALVAKVWEDEIPNEEYIAHSAYALADAMLARRQQRREP